MHFLQFFLMEDLMTENELTPRQQLNIQKWTGLIRECRQSGLTVTRWCSDNGINPRTYYHWLGKLRSICLEIQKNSPASSAGFVEITSQELPQTGSADMISIRKGDVLIELSSSCDLSTILSVVREVILC